MAVIMAAVDVDVSVVAAVRGRGHGCSCGCFYPPSFPGLFSCALVRTRSTAINRGWGGRKTVQQHGDGQSSFLFFFFFYPNLIQLDWTPSADTRKINLRTDRKGYYKSEIVDGKLSARRIGKMMVTRWSQARVTAT